MMAPLAVHAASNMTFSPTQVLELASTLRALMLECFNRKEPAPRPSSAVLSAARCALQNTQAQHSEDLLLLPTLLLAAGGRPGTFVELGALDGVQYSNTFVLERCFGWRGLLIEGNPTNFARLQSSTRIATKVHSAVCDGVGTVEFSVNGQQEAGDFSVLPKAALATKAFAAGLARVNVPCRSLASIMDDAGFSGPVHFFSLDVQGAEYKVIATARPEQFHLIMAETYGLGADREVAARVAKRVTDAGLRPVSTLSNASIVLYGSALFAQPTLEPVQVWPSNRKRLTDSIYHFNLCKRRLQTPSKSPIRALWGEPDW